MSFTALICARAPSGEGGRLRAELTLAGQALVEYQARQAADAGAARVLILAGAVTPLLARTIDRLLADRIDAALVRDLVTLGRAVGQDERLLFVGDGMILPQGCYRAVAGARAPALLVTGAARATGSFERIDAMHMWAGTMLIPASILHATIDMLGDWDFQSTLLRATVQAAPARVEAPTQDVVEARLALVETQASADIVTGMLLPEARGGDAREPGPAAYLLAPGAALGARLLVRQEVGPRGVTIAALALALLGLVTAPLIGPLLPLLLLLAALFVGQVGDRLRRLTRRPAPAAGLGWVLPGAALIGIVLVAQRAGGTLQGAYLAALLAILVHAGELGLPRAMPGWAVASLPSALMLLLLGALAGLLAGGYALAILLALASLGFLTHHLARDSRSSS
jgi:hypothetical protein